MPGKWLIPSYESFGLILVVLMILYDQLYPSSMNMWCSNHGNGHQMGLDCDDESEGVGSLWSVKQGGRLLKEGQVDVDGVWCFEVGGGSCVALIHWDDTKLIYHIS
ncbi:hypothetical protein BU17DRAFT_61900 [Hysterangium stoloniferum]|nr:hypothetical protein BU17DRAFT_61900 [Hysterangium stoloniferum]